MPGGFPGLPVQFVTSGSYQRATSDVSNITLTIGTETEIPLLAANIVCTEDALLSWVRYYWLVQAYDELSAYEWYVIKCQSTDALQDLSDPAIVEGLQREKRIFKRGVAVLPNYVSGAPRLFKFEAFNVKLIRGEELRLVIRPFVSNTADHVRTFGLLEWRQVGV